MNILQTVFNAPQENPISASIKRWIEDQTAALRAGYVNACSVLDIRPSRYILWKPEPKK